MEEPVSNLLAAHRAAIAVACERFAVARLGLFGSGAQGHFDPGESDLDFLVVFRADAAAHAFDNYFGLLERLEEILGRKVDLVTAASVRNPYFKREIERTLVPVYAADASEAVG